MKRNRQLGFESTELDRWENEGGRCREALRSSTDIPSSSLDQENESLHRVLVGMNRGLLQYASQCQLWSPAAERHRRTLLNRLAVRQQASIQQLCEFLDERKHPIKWGAFPVEYTRFNYMALDFLWPKIADFQAQLVRMLDVIRNELKHDRLATNVLDDIIQSELAISAELTQASPVSDVRQQFVRKLGHAATDEVNGRDSRRHTRNQNGRDTRAKRGSLAIQESKVHGMSHAS